MAIGTLPEDRVQTFTHEKPRLWGLSFSVLGDVLNWDSGQTQSPSSLGPIVQIQTQGSLKYAFWAANNTNQLTYFTLKVTKHVVSCQRGGVSNKPPWLHAAKRHGQGSFSLLPDKVNDRPLKI